MYANYEILFFQVCDYRLVCEEFHCGTANCLPSSIEICVVPPIGRVNLYLYNIIGIGVVCRCLSFVFLGTIFFNVPTQKEGGGI